MSSSDVIAADPWAVADVADVRRRLSHRASLAFATAGAWALGAFGPVRAVQGLGVNGREGAWILAATGLVWAVALTADPLRRWWAAVLALGAAVAAVGLSQPLIGRAPAPIALVGIAIAHAALVRWRPLPRWPERHVAVVVAALPFLVLAALTWARSQRAVVVLALDLVALAVVELHHRRPDAAHRLDAGLRRATRSVADVVGVVAMLVVAIPFLYLPGLVVRAAAALRSPRGRRASWIERDLPQAAVRRDATRTFATTAPAERRGRYRWGAVVTVVALVALGVARGVDPGAMVQGALDATRTTEVQRPQVPGGLGSSGGAPSDGPQAYRELPAFAGASYAPQLVVDQLRLAGELLEPSPIGDYQVAEYRSQTTNVRGAARVTRPAPTCSCRTATVWFMGGSAAFGMGQRDDHTIASNLVAAGEQAGWSLTVRNIAVPGWSIWQEYQGVLARLALEDEQPDLIVFYDGFNDVAGSLFRSTEGTVDPRLPSILSSDDVKATLAGGTRSFGSPAAVRAIGLAAADRYRSFATLIDRQLADLGIASTFVFQPDAFTTSTQRQGLAVLYDRTPGAEALFTSASPALEAAARALEPEVHDLRHLFDRERTPVFVDTVHTNERAARISADAVFELIEPDLSAAGT